MVDYKIKRLLPYFILITFLSLFSVSMGLLLQNMEYVTQTVLFQTMLLGSMLLVGYYIRRVAPITAMSTYIWALLAGMAMKPFLIFFNRNLIDLTLIIELCAALIFFTVGLETPFKNLKKWFLPIASLSVLGLVLSAFGFAAFTAPLLSLFSIERLHIPSLILLGAALSSVDPTAIIPSLKKIHLKKNKLLLIEESIMTDITGTVLTRLLLILLISIGFAHSSLSSFMFSIPPFEISYVLSVQLIVGLLIGFIGYFILQKVYRDDEKQPFLLLSIPWLSLGLGNIIAGAGLLASFMTGLLADISGDMKKSTLFYDHILDSFVKPFIFVMLGSLTPLPLLLYIAPIGIIIGLLFMFVLRPLVTFVSLFPWIIEHKLHLKEVIFLSFMRQSGVVTAILLILASDLQLLEGQKIIAIGIWVLLVVLVLEPPFIPYLADKLRLNTKR